jgi:hypothetical protein
MPWPPQVGELLPRYDEPARIEEKLSNYSLVPAHEVGGPKANGFLAILGIDLASLDYLDARIRDGIAHTPISKIEPREADAWACTVRFQIAGVGHYSHREAWLRTGWLVDEPGARPRLSTAFLRGKEDR